MQKIKILFHGSCWPTNIGNAFVNLGAIHCLKTALGTEGDVVHIGGMSDYLFGLKGKISNTFPFSEIVECDYLVHSGMIMEYAHLVKLSPIYKKYIKRGTKIIFLGGGAGRYNAQELDIVRKAMKEFPVYAFISRDSYTFKNYGDLPQYSYDGIDSALFIADCIHPIPLNLPKFNVMTFDYFKEPTIDHKGRLVVRTHHACLPSLINSQYYNHPYTLISDLPSDYLTIYSQAEIVFSDRVHACLPTLAFGRLARMYFREKDKRLHMFKRVGVPDIYKKPVKLNLESINKEKKKQIDFLHKILIEEAPPKKSHNFQYNESSKTLKPQSKITDEKLSSRSLSTQLNRQNNLPDFTLYLLIQDNFTHLHDLIDSIINQVVSNFELIILNNTNNNKVETIVNAIISKYPSYKIEYQQFNPDIPLFSIINSAKGQFISFISPEMSYTPYFLYELSKILTAKPQIDIIFANYQQLNHIAIKTIKNTEKDFLKNNNLGYCFIMRKDVITGISKKQIPIFKSNQIFLMIKKKSQIYHISQVLGSRYVSFGRIGKLLNMIRMLIDIGRTQGWRKVIQRSINYYKKSQKRFRISDKIFTSRLLQLR